MSGLNPFACQAKKTCTPLTSPAAKNGGLLQADAVSGVMHGNDRLRYLVTASDTDELVSGPYSKDGAHCEVGVHNGGAVQGVKGNTESLACTFAARRHNQGSQVSNRDL